MLNWGFYRNLENSLKDFLQESAINDGVTDIDGLDISVRIGRVFDKNWTLPCISVYLESETAPRLEIGSNKRQSTQLMIIDIFATNEGERLDLANWVTDTINDGFMYYSYSNNPLNPESPIKSEQHLVHLDFINNTRVNLGQTIDEIDNHRHQITFNVFITGA